MTPWFAAASGFVIAASLWIYSPHARLLFPAATNAIGTESCPQDNCLLPAKPNGPSPLASSATERRAHRSSSAGQGADIGARHQTAATGLTFSYVVVWDQNDKFAIKISVSAKHVIKAWTLAFVMRGDRIRDVWGAQWQRAGRDGGTASNLVDEQQRPGEQTGPDGPEGAQQQDGFSFWVTGTGAVAKPSNCKFDGATCTFRSGSAG